MTATVVPTLPSAVRIPRRSQFLRQSLRACGLYRREPIAPARRISGLQHRFVPRVSGRSNSMPQQAHAAITPTAPFPVGVHEVVHGDVGVLYADFVHTVMLDAKRYDQCGGDWARTSGPAKASRFVHRPICASQLPGAGGHSLDQTAAGAPSTSEVDRGLFTAPPPGSRQA